MHFSTSLNLHNLLHWCPTILPTLQVYPYSLFHIFFEQYLNTHRNASQHLTKSAKPAALVPHHPPYPTQVYPYSVFHIFFEQYLNTHRDARLLVGLPLLAVFGAAWLFTGSLWGSSILLAMLISLMLQLAGSMYMSGIEVNAGECAGG
jgi:hypothetical protein